MIFRHFIILLIIVLAGCGGAGSSDEPIQEVTAIAVNQLPIVNLDDEVLTSKGLIVSLDGSRSSDPDGSIVFYEWSQVSGPRSIQVDSINSPIANFIAPQVSSTETYTFELNITDNSGESSSDVINVTVLPLLPHSQDARIIYVSSSDGDDSTANYYSGIDITNALSPSINIMPYKTIAAAFQNVRTNYPDWVLLKRGDVWEESNFNVKSGRSSNEPAMFAYYGTSGSRPLLKVGGDYAINIGDGILSNIVIHGLDFYSNSRDPQNSDYDPTIQGSAGLRLIGGGENIIIENSKISYFNTGIIMQSHNGNSYRNIIFRNNIVSDNYALSPDAGHSAGMFIKGVDGILFEENVFDHNGWNKDVLSATATMFNHNLYIQYDNVGNSIVVRNNVFSRGSSHGIHGRPGGLYENNLFIQNAIGLQLSYQGYPLKSGTHGIATNNVVLEGRMMDPTLTNPGVTTAVWGIYIEQNALWDGGSVSAERNLVIHAIDEGTNIGLSEIEGVTYDLNIIHNWKDSTNMYSNEWSNPDISVADFAAYRGIGQTTEDYINHIKSRPINSDYSEYHATSVNDFIRAGFFN